MKRSVAVALVKGFRLNGNIEALDYQMLRYLRTKYGFLRQRRIQSLLGNYCKRAADAIWDGNDAAAVEALVKYGLRDPPNIAQRKEQKRARYDAHIFRAVRLGVSGISGEHCRASSGGLTTRARSGKGRPYR